jgi:MATE family multidrug resistance protein
MAQRGGVSYTRWFMFTLVRRLLRMAWPVTLARLGIMGMGVCDAMVVGRLAPEELPHQALGWAPTAVLLVSGIGLLLGVQVLGARALGANDPAQAGGALQRGIVVSLVGGGVAALLVYFECEHVLRAFGIAPELAAPAARVAHVLALSVPFQLCYVSLSFFVEAIQRPLVSAWSMAFANIVNLLLNLWWVPGHGAMGSAWATVGARVALISFLGVYVLRLPDAAQLGLRARCPRPSYREFLAVGSAAAVSQAAEAGAFSGMTVVAGRLGAHAVAAYQIALNLMSVVFMCSLGMSTATAVLVAEAIGRNEPREAARVSWLALAVNTAFMSCIAITVNALAGGVASAYTVDVLVAGIVASVMPLAATSMLADGGQAVVATALRAQGDNWFPTASHLLSYAVVMPALGFTLAELEHHGVRGLLEAINVTSGLSVAVLAARLWILTQRAHPTAAEPA